VQVAATQLQNREPVWVARLGPVQPAAEGGVPVDARRRQLASAFGVTFEETDVFTNRDTVVTADGQTPPEASVSASQRYVFTPAQDQPGAAAICARNAALRCAVLHLAGAARDAGSQTVLLLQPLPSATSLADLDAKLDELRTTYGRPTVFATTGALVQNLPEDRAVPFVTGFATEAEARQFCTDHQIQPCTPHQFG
jgi:hypothetical protein